eukprot:UN03805
MGYIHPGIHTRTYRFVGNPKTQEWQRSLLLLDYYASFIFTFMLMQVIQCMQYSVCLGCAPPVMLCMYPCKDNCMKLCESNIRKERCVRCSRNGTLKLQNVLRGAGYGKLRRKIGTVSIWRAFP